MEEREMDRRYMEMRRREGLKMEGGRWREG